MNPEREEFDFIVVGSGAGGGPLAANLALAGHSVLVLEAGSEHDCGYYRAPIMQAYASEDPNMTWQFFARHFDDEAAQAQDTKYVPERKGVLYPRGSTVGGSTAVSAMVMVYPHASDWDGLAQLTGDNSWSAANMRPFFERLERWQGVPPEPMPGDSEADRDAKAAHGTQGWLPTTRANPSVGGREPMFLDIIRAIEKTARNRLGVDESIPLPRDPNAADTPEDFEGMAFIPVAVSEGERRGSRERLMDVAQRPDCKLEIRTDSLATKVLFEADRAVGVQYLVGARLYDAAPQGKCEITGEEFESTPNPKMHEVFARREVILSGGTFNTPQLLKLSGIGPRKELEQHGIDVVLDVPGVGENLHDRYEVTVLDEVDRPYPVFDGSLLDVPPGPEASNDPLWSEWRDRKDGPFTTNGSLAALVAKSSVAQGASDLIIFSLPIDFHGYYPGYSKDAVAQHTMLSTLILKGHTRNRAGSVTLKDSAATSVPHITFRSFDEGSGDYEADLAGVVDGVEIARDIADNLEAMTARELIPGRDVNTREGLARFVHSQAWGHHACGTAKIGRPDDPMAVLDGDFRVRGVKGLRVVDASVFPDIPGFFIVSAVYMVSEKASDVILAQNS